MRLLYSSAVRVPVLLGRLVPSKPRIEVNAN